MTNHIESIRAMAAEGKRDELVQLAISQGLPKPHHKAKPETIAELIINHVTQPPKSPEMLHPAEKPQAAPAKIHTPDEVREACKAYFDKPGFEAIFNEDDTWHFKCRGAEDSGHMSCALRVIKMKAETVSHGARKMVTMKFDGEEIMRA